MPQLRLTPRLCMAGIAAGLLLFLLATLPTDRIHGTYAQTAHETGHARAG
ncbi:MAG TPA: hypothetical protein VHL08_06670 [Dongiaceae bacterium]|jgi:hypothetical protein|nr:hypothetical protein [Dongiaceae bacterium]